MSLLALAINSGNIVLTNGVQNTQFVVKTTLRFAKRGGIKKFNQVGLDKDYITPMVLWFGETFTLISPYVKVVLQKNWEILFC